MKLAAHCFYALAMLFLSVAAYFATDHDAPEITPFDAKLWEDFRFRQRIWLGALRHDQAQPTLPEPPCPIENQPVRLRLL